MKFWSRLAVILTFLLLSQTMVLAADVKIAFMHHSTGNSVWNGGVKQWFNYHNSKYGTNYQINEYSYPASPYPWANYPFDYWNLWINHSGNNSYKGQYTLDQLASYFDIIVFKHCFPVSGIQPDTGRPDITSERKSIENYKLQYLALRNKMRQYPNKKFIIWTGAALTSKSTNPQDAQRAQMFFNWVKNVWDQKGDNIYVWDFHQLETGGGLYLKNDYAASPYNSHPNTLFSKYAAEKFYRRVINVIEGRGDNTSITG